MTVYQIIGAGMLALVLVSIYVVIALDIGWRAALVVLSSVVVVVTVCVAGGFLLTGGMT